MGKDMQVSSRNIINTFLESGFGVAYLPKVSVEREVEEGRICEIQTALPKIDLGVILLKNSNHAESSAASLFSKLVKNELYDGKMDRSDLFFQDVPNASHTQRVLELNLRYRKRALQSARLNYVPRRI